MKYINILLVLLVSYSLGLSQSTFEYAPEENSNDYAGYVIEKDNGDFLLSRGGWEEDGQNYRTGFFELSSNGELIQQKFINEGAERRYSVNYMEETDSVIYVVGNSVDTFNHVFIWFCKLNESFDVLYQKEYLTDSLRINPLGTIKINEGKWLILGYRYGTPTNSALAIINQDGEIEHHANYPSSILNYPSGALVKNDSTGFLVKNYWNDFTHVKNNLEIDSIISIFPFTFPTIFFATPNMIKELNDTTFLIAGRRFIDQSSESDYAIRSVENMSDLVHEHIIETDTASSPALNVSIDFQNTNQIYFGGWQRNPPQTLYESPTQSSLPGWFILTQLNETLEPNWTRYYGGDSHYVMQGLIATKDGGCLMYGSRYDEVEGRDIYILKVGPNGLLTSTTTPETTTNITVYPNPTSNYIFFDTGEASMYDVSFFDGLGKVIFQEKIPNNRPVDVRHLPVGIYTYVLERKGEIVSQGKWVKE